MILLIGDSWGSENGLRDTMDQMINETFERKKPWEQHPQWFWPDGLHANRQGHRKLLAFLISQGHIR